ncbi:MAG: hypothetical protein ISS72_10245 [Candidatus Brocadiae bacterium]|nr:hypothetical protein [Candidatus Brocadiia bacterium]
MHPHLSRRRFVLGSAAAVAGLAARGATPAERKKPMWPFYAFDNGLRTIKGYEDQAKLLKDLGYVGLEYHLNHQRLPEMLEALDTHGLELNAVYTVPWAEQPVDPKLGDSIKLMKGRATRIEMGIRSKTFKKPSDPAGDPQAIELMTRVSDLCGDTGPVVSVYPHAWFWTEKVDDGARLAKKIGRKNVGTNFNLVHWTWVKQSRSVEATLRDVLPHLFSVTINNGTTKGRKIYALDQGDYDLLGFLGTVKKVGYTGPVGLQCYSVPGASEAHLKRSMAVWQALTKKLGVAGA